MHLTIQWDWWSDAHLGAPSGCAVKEKSEGEAMPWAVWAPDGQRNCGGAVGPEDGGRDAYEAESLGLALGLWGSSFFRSDRRKVSPCPPRLGRCFYRRPLPEPGGRRTAGTSFSCFLLISPLHPAPGWKGQSFLPPARQGLSSHILTSS